MIFVSFSATKRKIGTYFGWILFKIVSSWSRNVIGLVFKGPFGASNFRANIFIALERVASWAGFSTFFDMMLIFGSNSKALRCFGEGVLINIIISRARHIGVFMVGFQFVGHGEFGRRIFGSKLIFSRSGKVVVFNTVAIGSSDFAAYGHFSNLIREVILSRSGNYGSGFISISALGSFG